MKKTRNIFLIIIAGGILISTIFSIKNQFSTLKSAEQKNIELETKIEDLTKLTQKLKSQIEYATSSAFIDRQSRQLLGLGEENDTWITLSPEKKIVSLNEIKESVEIPKYKQWLNLFTQ